jgi:hypothetical protein
MEDVATIPDFASQLIDPATISPLMVSEFKLWFCVTDDWYMQNPMLMPRDMEDAPGCVRVRVPITRGHILRHLSGQHTIGLYAVNPVVNTCKWFALDGDYPGAEAHLAQIAETMRLDGLAPAFENSRRGAHLWVLFSEPVEARLCRIYVYSLLDQGGYAIAGRGGRKEGIEVNPKHESLDDGQVGNGIRAPLGVHRKVHKRFWFRDAEPTLEGQFRFLRNLPRCTPELIEELTLGMDMPEDMIPVPRDQFAPAKTNGIFDIRFYIDPPRRRNTKGDYFVQCPSCAEAGKDNGRDNLHVTEQPSGPPLFHCFAQCRGIDVISACHRRAGYYSGRRSE